MYAEVEKLEGQKCLTKTKNEDPEGGKGFIGWQSI